MTNIYDRDLSLEKKHEHVPYDKVSSSMELIKEFDPKNIFTLYGMDATQIELANLGEMQKTYVKITYGTSLGPEAKYLHALLGKGIALSGLGRHREALECFKTVIKFTPQDSNAWYRKGMALGKLDRHKDALGSFEKAVELDPQNANAWYGKGAALTNLNRWEDALGPLEKAIELDPGDTSALLVKGIDLGNLNRHEDALGSFEKAVELDPNNASAWFNKGLSLGNLNRYEDASNLSIKRSNSIRRTPNIGTSKA